MDRSIFSLLDREVWVVTAESRSRAGGLLATWVSPASIDPGQPMVLVAIAPNHYTCSLIEASGSFGLHLLRPDQVDVAFQFASRSGWNTNKLQGLATSPGASGVPLLDDCRAVAECTVFARLTTGDRVYFWADVVLSRVISLGEPLRETAFLARLSAEQKETLNQCLKDDLRLHQPLFRQWRGQLPESLQPNPPSTPRL